MSVTCAAMLQCLVTSRSKGNLCTIVGHAKTGTFSTGVSHAYVFMFITVPCFAGLLDSVKVIRF